MIVVDLALATICFLHQGQQECHNALVGPSTPKGTFSLVQRLTSDPGYGGDVLQFHEDKQGVYAIHRVWTLRSEQRRQERLASSDASRRTMITSGCVNVDPVIYSRLLSCCINQPLMIK